ncbi:hypothetical protein [Baekduia sp. Peel2402]|uniref:hypothetical protein n=1 Tax=Baekduia sp. Peel2402 TaxID=3458296 RepID=UPI00403E56E8
MNAPLSATFTASVAEPFVHVDERAVVFYDGTAAVQFERARLRWVHETLTILLDDGRATRTHGVHTLGGFLGDDGTATVYAFTAAHEPGIALAMPKERLIALRDALGTHP